MKKLFDYFYDEINFKEIFKDPKRWVGYSFILFFLMIFALSIVYLDQIDQFYRNETPYDEPDTAKLFKDVPLSLGRKVEGLQISLIKNPSDEMMNRGEEIYKTTCATCHGEAGKGDGIAGKGLNPPPRNFTSPDGWKNGRSITQIYKTLQEGIPGTGMVSYSYLSPKEKIALFYIIKKLGKDIPEVTDKDLEELETNYKITQTYELPPTIPIPSAIDKLVKENQKLVEKSKTIEEKLIDSKLIRFIEDKEKFANFLINTKNFKENPEGIIISNFPLNGISTKFIYASSQEKKKFIEKLLSLN